MRRGYFSPVRSPRVVGDIAIVPLTHGFDSIIDAEDVGKVSAWSWHAKVTPTNVRAARTEKKNGKTRRIYMHRVILASRDGVEVDHRDGDGLNNRKSNLREATHSQNCQNVGRQKNNTSGYKGVYWNGHVKAWVSYIQVNKRSIYLGRFVSKEVAFEAYCAASREHHGEFSNVGAHGPAPDHKQGATPAPDMGGRA